jgi:hypothetical protein
MATSAAKEPGAIAPIPLGSGGQASGVRHTLFDNPIDAMISGQVKRHGAHPMQAPHERSGSGNDRLSDSGSREETDLRLAANWNDECAWRTTHLLYRHARPSEARDDTTNPVAGRR